MSKVLVIGCSFSDQCGWKDPDGKIWWHHLDQRWGGEHNVTAVVRDGNTNDELLLMCAEELRKDSTYDVVFIQWSDFFRQNFYLTNSISGQERVYFGMNSVRPNSVNSAYHGTPHDLSLKNWQKYYVNAKHIYNKNLDYFILAAEYLSLKEIPFVFINWTGRARLKDLFEPDFNDTTTEYKNEVLLWPVCSSSEAQEHHSKLHQKIKYLDEISGTHWTDLAHPYWAVNNVDFSDDGVHPGILTTQKILNDALTVARSLGYDI